MSLRCVRHKLTEVVFTMCGDGNTCPKGPSCFRAVAYPKGRLISLNYYPFQSSGAGAKFTCKKFASLKDGKAAEKIGILV